ncbi:MAG: hypothetical protein IJI60_04075 [Bacilli bacterium]|nr:hypothetical protein [Bacilli bacterium]
MFTNYSMKGNYPTTYYEGEDRFFLAPLLVGGLAGTALGYGIANNNQMNHSYYPAYPMTPVYYSYPYPYPSYSNNYYYS